MEDNKDKESKSESKPEESKHKIKGKHSLKYDSIFKGKKGDEDIFDEFSTDFHIPKQENFEFDTSSNYYYEHTKPDDYARLKELREIIYDVIVNKTNINIKNSRRKPSRVDFNKYMDIIVKECDVSKYSHSEIFIEFSFYFSDNIVNMFKLLDKKWGGKIALELAEKTNFKLDDIDFV